MKKLIEILCILALTILTLTGCSRISRQTILPVNAMQGSGMNQSPPDIGYLPNAFPHW